MLFGWDEREYCKLDAPIMQIVFTLLFTHAHMSTWVQLAILHSALEMKICKRLMHFTPTMQTTKCIVDLHVHGWAQPYTKKEGTLARSSVPR